MDTASHILGIVCGLLLHALFGRGLFIAAGPPDGHGKRPNGDGGWFFVQ